MRGVAPAESSTILSPPVGSYDPNNGHIAVKVLGSDATPLGGVPVTVTTTGFTRTLTTTSPDGCAFFAFVAPASYTVTLGAVNYVDRQGRANPSQVTGVTSGATSSVSFDYDRASALTLTMTSPGGGSFPSSLSVDVGNSALVPTGSKEFPGAGAIRTVGNLYPYADGYEAWAGSCADADPEGKDGNGLAFWPGATRDPWLSTSRTMAARPVCSTRSGPSTARTCPSSRCRTAPGRSRCPVHRPMAGAGRQRSSTRASQGTSSCTWTPRDPASARPR
jgi:hypothetical protein